MKKLFTLLALILIISPALSQNQERLSVHYLDVPPSLVQDFIDFNKKRNLILEEAGFGKDFYKLYKVNDSDEAKRYKYFMISQYTSDKHYEMTHNVSEDYEELNNYFRNSKMAKIFSMDDKTHIYRKVYKLE
tara:strand:- start:160 stop:555 length:396 start_codon:yes stop_codon:yes gene_type:complete